MGRGGQVARQPAHTELETGSRRPTDTRRLVAEAVPDHKLRMRWTGPHEVTATVNKYCYKVRPIVPPPQKRKMISAHIVCIRRFSNTALGTEADRRRIEESAIKDFPDNFVHKLSQNR